MAQPDFNERQRRFSEGKSSRGWRALRNHPRWQEALAKRALEGVSLFRNNSVYYFCTIYLEIMYRSKIMHNL